MAQLAPVYSAITSWTGSDVLVERDDDLPVTRPDPAGEIVAVPLLDSVLGEVGFDLYGRFHRRQRLHVLRAMMTTPPGQSSAYALKSTALSGGFQFTPALRPSDDEEPDPDVELSKTILEQCKRAADALETPLEVWAWEMLDGIFERVKLAEIVMDPVLEGPDAGLYGLKSFKVKPRWSWRFDVDAAMNVVAIRAWTVDNEWVKLDPRHFVWLAWDARDGDPRGNTVLDAAFHAFNMLCQLWPEALQGWKQFAFPNILLTNGPNDRKDVPIRDASGNYTGKTESAETRLARQGAMMKSGAVIAGTHGTEGKVLESVRDGAMMEAAIQFLQAEIIVCVLLQTRSIREAEFGSKADAENGTGVVGTFAQVVRQWLCAAVRKPFMAMVEANHDAAIARRLTPKVTLGKIDPRQFAAIAQSFGVLYQSGYFTARQLLWLDEFLGLPIRDDDDERVGPQKDTAGAPPADAPPSSDPKLIALFGEIKTLLMERGMPDAA